MKLRTKRYALGIVNTEIASPGCPKSSSTYRVEYHQRFLKILLYMDHPSVDLFHGNPLEILPSTVHYWTIH